ncbi:MAG: rhomboid family intramembrane serine protease [Candidatus Melainabacteria bacterium]|nr:rhomboid family intramembrane serine protease [Candidatus Melainabacteria bacterium]
MTQSTTKPVDETLAEARPWVTIILVLLCVWGFYASASHGMLWSKNHGFSLSRFVYQLDHRAYVEMLAMMFWSTFMQLNIWHFIGNTYFLWVFGSTIETRLGTVRFLLLTLVCIFGGWYLLVQHAGGVSEHTFVGPGLLISGIIGGYLVFFPEKKISPGGAMRRTYRIFHDEPTPNPAESFGVSPWLVLCAFVVFETLIHFVFAGRSIGLDSISLVPALEIFGVALIVSLLLVMSATHALQGHPLMLVAMTRYRQLRALDMTHEEAIAGTARLLSVPSEKVKEWIAKDPGVLRKS